MKPKLFFDSGCPVCSEYKRLVKNKLGDSVEYVPIEAYKSDFEYNDANGKKYVGSKAVEKLSEDFPAIKDYVWILPEKLKVTGLKVAYKVGSVVRKTIATVHHGCNCGKH
jgi:predicted DCC family thiol-disulfide oxidoreductase YuxK